MILKTKFTTHMVKQTVKMAGIFVILLSQDGLESDCPERNF